MAKHKIKLSDQLLGMSRRVRRFERSTVSEVIDQLEATEQKLHKLRATRDRRVRRLELEYSNKIHAETSRLADVRAALESEIERRTAQKDDTLYWVLAMTLCVSYESACRMSRDEIVAAVLAAFPHEPGGNGRPLFTVVTDSACSEPTLPEEPPLTASV